MSNVMLSAALSLAGRGYPVFPCQPRGKAPLYASPHAAGSAERATCRGECGRWGHGLLDATTDEATITAWWTRTPSANVAIATGPGSVDVLDVDIKDGKPGMATFARLRDAGLLRGAFAVIGTPSGAFHLWFAGTSQRCAQLPRFGIDLRADGGCAMAPPSYAVAKNGDYEGPYLLAEYQEPTGVSLDWAAIRDLLDPPRPRKPRAPRSAGDEPNPCRFDGLIDFLKNRPPGDRNAPLNWAAYTAARDGADDDVFDAMLDAITGAGHNVRDAAATIASARRAAGGRR